MPTNQSKRRRLGLETLEDKRLLAGDVSVTVVEGNLLVRGDEASNGVAITSGDAASEYVVVGLPVGDAATSINGTFERVVVTGVSGGIRMGLGRGDDVFNLFQANVRGYVSVATGLGNDHVNIGGPQTQVSDMNTVIQGRLLVDLGEGNDSLRIGGSEVEQGLEAHGGMGNDDVAIRASRLGGVSSIGTGAGYDEVTVGGTHAEFLRVQTGDDADQVALVDSAFSGVGVNLGQGSDELVLAGVRAETGYFQGGPGHDALRLNGLNQFGRLRIAGFESAGGSDAAVDSMFGEASAIDADDTNSDQLALA